MLHEHKQALARATRLVVHELYWPRFLLSWWSTLCVQILPLRPSEPSRGPILARALLCRLPPFQCVTFVLQSSSPPLSLRFCRQNCRFIQTDSHFFSFPRKLLLPETVFGLVPSHGGLLGLVCSRSVELCQADETVPPTRMSRLASWVVPGLRVGCQRGLGWWRLKGGKASAAVAHAYTTFLCDNCVPVRAVDGEESPKNAFCMYASMPTHPCGALM